MAVYDAIGAGYNTTRQADAFIVHRLQAMLQPHSEGVYLDIGCGTGNYLGAFLAQGFSFIGVDPSATMLDVAQIRFPTTTFLQASAADIPLPDAWFDGAIAVLTLHHWEDQSAGLAGVARVLKPGARLVFLSFTPEQMRGYWLYHYFPQMIERCIQGIPNLRRMKTMLKAAGFSRITTEKYFMRPEHSDHFLYSYKSRPAEYLKESVRNNASAFRLHCPEPELQQGLEALRADINSGHIQQVVESFDNEEGDYLFISAQR